MKIDHQRPQPHLRDLVANLGLVIKEGKNLQHLAGDTATLVEAVMCFDVELGRGDRSLDVCIRESYLLSELASLYRSLLESASQHATTFGVGVFIGALNCLADDREHEKGDGWRLWLKTLAEGLLKFAELLLFSDQPLGSLSMAVSGLLSNSVAEAVKNEDCLKVFVRRFLRLFWSKMSPAVNPRIVSGPVLQVVNEFLVKGWNQADPFQKAFALEMALEGDPNLRKQV